VAGVDGKMVAQVLESFVDRRSDCVTYPELLAFLLDCSGGHVMRRLHALDGVRQRQGYHLAEFLKALAKKGTKVDAGKFTDLLMGLGIFLTETALATVFAHLGTPAGNLDVPSFVAALEDGGTDLADKAVLRPTRVEAKPFAAGGKDAMDADDLAWKILKEYDDRMTKSVERAFDVFDEKNKNELPVEELERIFCCLGLTPPSDDLSDLVAEIDPKKTGKMGFNEFFLPVVRYVGEPLPSFPPPPLSSPLFSPYLVPYLVPYLAAPLLPPATWT